MIEDFEPLSVREARRVIREWELRNGHAAYPEPLDGGMRGYQAACHNCDWRGTEFLRDGKDPFGEANRAHKREARAEAAQHMAETKPVGEQDPTE